MNKVWTRVSPTLGLLLLLSVCPLLIDFCEQIFFSLNSNFEQATQKYKKLSYMAKLITTMPIIMAPV